MPSVVRPCVWLGLLIASLTTACQSPVGVRISDAREVQRYLTRNALTEDRPSDFTANALRRYELLDLWERQPLVALANLHVVARESGFPPDALFALTELSFLHAERTKTQAAYASTVVYAWALLFPETGPAPLGLLDPRARIAADLYNRALILAFRRTKDGTLRHDGRDGLELPLPFGRLTVRARENLLSADGSEFHALRPVTELQVQGLRNRYRHPGVGAPVAARARPLPGTTPVVALDPSALVPLTVLAVVDEPMAGLARGELEAHLEVYSSLDALTVDVGNRTIPLESEPTAALAASLAESRFWESELRIFLGNAIGLRRESALRAVRPYRRGRIPVVFVHGTASSPARWADMINDLLADPFLRERYAYWTFRYDSGNPIAYSGWQLRDALAQAVERADPSGTDPCVRDMVVLGHSQGGLLTKLTAVDAEDRLWRNLSERDFETVDLPAGTKDILRNTLFVKPLPFVREVIFLATPQRGSYLASPRLVRRLAERFVRLPSDILRVGVDIVTLSASGDAGVAFNRIPTSIDNMSPSNPFLRTLSGIPVAPGVRAHSIVAVERTDIPLDRAGDGVVKYASAHLDGIDSEVIVHSPHSGMQSAPKTIERVREILIEHSRASRCPID